MSAKIIRNSKEVMETLILKEFSSVVERGEQKYKIRSFSDDEELSVQESRMGEYVGPEPDAVENRADEVTDNDYLPPSKLVKAGTGIIGEKVEMRASGSASFVESGFFSDAEESQNEYPTKVLRHDEIKGATHEQMEVFASEKAALDLRILELSTAIEAKDKEMEELNASIPAQLEKSKEEGRLEGVSEGELKAQKTYSAEKEDYLSKLDTFNGEALLKLDEMDKTIKSIDDEMTQTVIGFVKSIIGAERKINDTFVVQLIRANSEKLKELKVIRFEVNEADIEVMKGAFKNYPVEGNPTVAKGAVKIISKAGEVDLDSDSMIADLEKQINETIGTAVKP